MFRPSILLAALLVTASAAAQPEQADPPRPVPSAESNPARTVTPPRKPYLSEATAPDVVAILPAPPRGQSAAEVADRAAYNATRAYQGTPRWDLATNDVADGATAILDDLACVFGHKLDTARLPVLMNLLERVRLDVARATRQAKEHYRRLRPFVGNEAPICVMRAPELADSFSYPSGPSSQGWTLALIMAAIHPEKATQILVRGRIYGESRVVCGVQWLSDVEASRTNASAIYAALQGDATFRADLEKARAEFARGLAAGGSRPDPAVCTREAAAARPLF